MKLLTRESILQVEDLPMEDGSEAMTVRKFRAILAKVSQRIELQAVARLTFEVGRPDAAMQIFDVGTLTASADHALIRLMPRAALCKPRHRTEQEAQSCCAQATATACCR